MAGGYTQGGTITEKREQTEVYDIDKCYRYEITSTTSGAIIGGIYLDKDLVDAADAAPDTIALSTAA